MVALFGKNYFVRSVTIEEPERFGQIRLKQDALQVRGILLRNIALRDLEKVEGYLITTPGLEDVSCVDLLFSNGRKICFDGSNTDQQDLINEILLALQVDQINWSSELGPFTFEKLIVYKRTS